MEARVVVPFDLLTNDDLDLLAEAMDGLRRPPSAEEREESGQYDDSGQIGFMNLVGPAIDATLAEQRRRRAGHPPRPSMLRLHTADLDEQELSALEVEWSRLINGLVAAGGERFGLVFVPIREAIRTTLDAHQRERMN